MFASLRARQPGASVPSLLFYQLCSWSVRLLLQWFFGLRVIHPENLPSEGPLIVVANHQSYLDPPAVGSMLNGRRHFDFIAKVGLFKFKPFGWLIGSLNSIPVRGDGSDAASMKEVLRRLSMGRAVIIFPEGARSSDGEMQPFKRGAALLVKRAKCAVLPAAIDGAQRAWPVHQKLPHPFRHRVTVLYGTPIPHDELMKDGPDAAMDRLHDEVSRLLTSIRSSR